MNPVQQAYLEADIAVPEAGQIRTRARRAAVVALDNALRASQVMRASAVPDPSAELVVRAARRAIQTGQLAHAHSLLQRPVGTRSGAPAGSRWDPQAYAGAKVLDASGAEIGQVRRTGAGQVHLALDGIERFWGFIPLGRPRFVWMPLDRVVPGPLRVVGNSYAMLLPAAGQAGDRSAHARL